MSSVAIALLTVKPDREQVDFYQGFGNLGYDVFTIVDRKGFIGNSYGSSPVRVDEKDCLKFGFKHLNPEITFLVGRPCTAWEKALFFFAHVKVDNEYVWFLEDDVFVPSHRTVSSLDAKYDHDVVSTKVYFDSHYADPWHWWASVPRDRLAPPWGHGMVCAVRLSRAMLQAIFEFVFANRDFEPSVSPRSCFFIEYLFHSLAAQKGFRVAEAPELDGIQWRHDWHANEMRDGVLYHPVKSPQTTV